MSARTGKLVFQSETRKPSLLLITAANDASDYTAAIVGAAKAYLAEVPMLYFPDWDAVKLLPELRGQLPPDQKRTIEDKLNLGSNVIMAVPTDCVVQLQRDYFFQNVKIVYVEGPNYSTEANIGSEPHICTRIIQNDCVTAETGLRAILALLGQAAYVSPSHRPLKIRYDDEQAEIKRKKEKLAREAAWRSADFSKNIMLQSEASKLSQHKMYPEGTEVVYSYLESQGGKFPEVCFFGLQYYLKTYLSGQVVTREKIDQAKEVLGMHCAGSSGQVADMERWEYILKEHGGKLPVTIKAVAEGTVVPVKQAVLTIENTDPKCFWLPSYLESLVSQVWYPMTVATQSREQKKYISDGLLRTGATPEEMAGIGFKLHDFGYRGASSVESAALGGAAHLVNFTGTDNMAAVLLAKRVYGAEMAGFSVPAAEHSTITAWEKFDEREAFKNMLEQYPTGLVAVVSDSYDLMAACEKLWGEELKPFIEGREGTVVVRPDSGDPQVVVVDVLNALEKGFGSTYNEQGFKLLPSTVRVLQGDGISYNSIPRILRAMSIAGWAANNIAFGSGGALLQRPSNDMQNIQFSTSFVRGAAGDLDLKQKPRDGPFGSGYWSKAGKLTLELIDEEAEAGLPEDLIPRPEPELEEGEEGEEAGKEEPEPELEVDEDGNPVWELDDEGKPVQELDVEGNPVPAEDEDGNPVEDEEGNPVFKFKQAVKPKPEPLPPNDKPVDAGLPIAPRLRTRQNGNGTQGADVMSEVYRNGDITKEFTFEEVRANAALTEADSKLLDQPEDPDNEGELMPDVEGDWKTPGAGLMTQPKPPPAEVAEGEVAPEEVPMPDVDPVEKDEPVLYSTRVTPIRAPPPRPEEPESEETPEVAAEEEEEEEAD